MAVRAHDLALVHFLEDFLPRSVVKSLGDVELLVAQVIELEDDGIGFAAIRARMRREEIDQQEGAFELKLFLTPASLRDVLFAVRQVMLTPIGGLARAAMVLSLAFVA